MKTNSNLQKILNQPSYWVEGINGILYNAIVDYMDNNDLNRTELADFFGISKGRISQILNDGQINFSIEKLVEISLKIGKYPIFKLEDSESYINRLTETNRLKKLKLDFHNVYFKDKYISNSKKSESRIVRLKSYNTYSTAL